MRESLSQPSAAVLMTSSSVRTTVVEEKGLRGRREEEGTTFVLDRELGGWREGEAGRFGAVGTLCCGGGYHNFFENDMS